MAPEDLARPPRFATRRNPDLATRGGKVAVIAAEMGWPLLPHQQYIADVATELNPTGSRLRYRYQTVVISLPRQTGKTTLLRPIFLERALSRPGTEAFMTAQHGKDAGKRWAQLVAGVEASDVFGSFVKPPFGNVKRGNGDQQCLFPNGSVIAPFAPGPKSLHGYTPPLVLVDEGWAFSAEDGAGLMKAIRPAQQTRTDRQLFIISAAGEQTSEWWNALVEAGRRAVEDPRSKMAYFEWSMNEDLDPYDPTSWDFHPGLDGLITKDDLAEEAKPENNSHGDFLRGFMNVSTKVRDNTVLDLAKWDQRTRKAVPDVPAPEDMAWGYDVAVDLSSASVWAAWRDADNALQLAVVEHREGSAWLTDFLAKVLDGDHADYPAPGVIAADDGGPTRNVTAELVRRGYDVEVLTGRDSSTAWTNVKTHLKHATFHHDGSAALRSAIEVAVEKAAGDATALSRRHSLGPINPLIAAEVAAWYADRVDSSIPIY